MCNEYRFRQSLDRVVQEFSALKLPLHWAGGAPNLEPRDSIRPTDPAPVVLGSPEGAELRQLRWGFAQPGRGPVINFRSEGRRFPTGRYLSDLHLVSRTGRVDRVFAAGLGAFVRGGVHLHFADAPDAIASLRAAGFDQARLHAPREFADVLPDMRGAGADRVRVVDAVVRAG